MMKNVNLNNDSANRQNISHVQEELIKYFLKSGEGKRIPSIRQLSTYTQMSVGTISSVLNNLQDMGAVNIQKRGHLGSYLTKISVNKMWNLLGQGPLVIAMSLPMHSRFEGLAAGVKKAFEKAGIEAYLIFIRGSRTRLNALHNNRCHAVIMSGLAAEELTEKEDEIILTLPPTSWISGYGIFYRTLQPEPGRPLLVGVDSRSYDHRRLAELEFADQNIEIRYVSYIHIIQLLKKGEIDAFVWNTEQKDDLLGPGISYRPLSERVLKLVGQKTMSAVFVGRKGDSLVRAVIQTSIDPVELMGIQEQVVDGKIIPEY